MCAGRSKNLLPIPSLRTLTTRGLTRGDSQRLGRHSDGPFDLEALVLGALDQISTDLLQTFDVPAKGREI